MTILETERLTLRELTAGDAEFTLDLLNQPSFIKYIGDRRVRDLEQAREFIENRYRQSYRDHGFGLYLVELKPESTETENTPAPAAAAIGICGFVKRDSLPEPDIGFAFLPQFGKKGYAVEAAAATMKYGREKLGLKRILAITTTDNESSGRLLEKIGFVFEKLIENDGETLKLFSSDAG
jgi:[ribosomal protein S5]-alanine N-acetyltransferase